MYCSFVSLFMSKWRCGRGQTCQQTFREDFDTFCKFNGFNTSKRVIYRSEFIGLTTFRDWQGLFIAGQTGLLPGRWSRQKWSKENLATVCGVDWNVYATAFTPPKWCNCAYGFCTHESLLTKF